MPYHAAPSGASSVVAGAYRSTWNGFDLGLVSVDGHQLRYQNSAIPITADITGETVVDMIHTGTVPTITMTLQNWNAAAVEMLTWWMGTGVGLDNYKWGVTDGVGLNMFNYAKPLVLTACHFDAALNDGDGGAAVANPTIDPLTITFYKTILAPNQDLEILLSHRPRFITVTLQILPVTVTLEGSGPAYTVSRVTSCSRITFWDALRNIGSHVGEVP